MNLEDTKEQIKAAVDLRQLMVDYGVEVKRGGCCCPFHEEKTPSCKVYDDHYWCYGSCQAGGDCFEFVMQKMGVEFMEALTILSEYTRIALPERGGRGEGGHQGHPNESNSNDGPTRQDILGVLDAAACWYMKCLQHADGQAARAYCEARGLSSELLQTFGVGYAPHGFARLQQVADKAGYSRELLLAAGLIGLKEGDPISRAYNRFQDRLMFPIHDHLGKVIGFSGRVLPEGGGLGEGGHEADPNAAKRKTSKYVNTPETRVFRKGDVLYGYHQARRAIRDRGEVILTEGQIDTIACVKAGIPNAVAPLGTAFTEQHAIRLSRLDVKVILAFDGDDAGRKAVRRTIPMLLSEGIHVEVAGLPAGMDPDDLASVDAPTDEHR